MTCSVQDCDRPVVARTLCNSHYKRAALEGTLATYPTRGQQDRRKFCEVDGCDEYRYGNGLCRRHYLRKKRRGTTELRGPVESVGYIDRYGYRVIYKTGHPLARPSGRVSEHRLVAYAKYGPGDQACHWCSKPLTWARACVDHLDGQRQHNTPENLVVACGGCNSRRARLGNPTDFQPTRRPA